MRRRIFGGVILLCGLAPLSWAGTYLGIREWGDPVAGAGARSVAMGGTGLARGESAASFRLNPALAPDQRSLSLSLGPVVLTEKVAESATQTKLQDSGYLELNELSLAWPFRRKRFWCGLSAAPAYDFHYKADYTLYDSTGAPASENNLRDSGALWAVTVGAGLRPLDRLALGLSLDFLTGRETLRLRKYRHGWGTQADLREQARYRGLALRWGGHWRVNSSLSLGWIFQPSAKISRRFDLVNSTSSVRNRQGRDQWTLPPQWGLGLSYDAPGEQAAGLSLEIRQVLWSRVRINGRRPGSLPAAKPLFQEASASALSSGPPVPSSDYTDTTEILVGAEHALTPQWTLRYGFRHSAFFADRTVEATFLSFGAGYRPGGPWAWSLAGEWGKRDYEGETLFLASGQRADETLRRVLVSAEFFW